MNLIALGRREDVTARHWQEVCRGGLDEAVPTQDYGICRAIRFHRSSLADGLEPVDGSAPRVLCRGLTSPRHQSVP